MINNTESEIWVIGGLSLDPSVADQVFAALSPEDFFIADHAELFECMRILHSDRKGFDLPAMADLAEKRGRMPRSEVIQRYAMICQDVPSAANLMTHVNAVRDMSVRRKVITVATGLIEAARFEDGETLAMRLISGVESATRSTTARSKRFDDILPDIERIMLDGREKRRVGGVLGVPSGLRELDQRLGGFRPGRLYGIAARPGTGKTALLNQIGFHGARYGKSPGLICSLEMGSDELGIRALASHANVSNTRIEMGYEDECELAAIESVKLSDTNLWFDDETMTLQGIIAQMAAHKHRYGIKWAAVDHIGLVETEKFSSRNDQIGHITRTLKKAAKRLDIAIIGLFQLNRESEKLGRKPSLNDLRDSGNIEQDLDVAIFLHTDPDRRSEVARPLEIGLLKNRGGRMGWIGESFTFDGASQKIYSPGDHRPPRARPSQHWTEPSGNTVDTGPEIE